MEASTGQDGTSVLGAWAMVDIVNMQCIRKDLADILRTFAEVHVVVQDHLLADI